MIIYMKKLILLTLFLTTSCSSYLRTSATKMMSPESNGGFLKGTVSLHLEQYQASKMNFENSTTEAIEERDVFPSLNLYGDLGILEGIDLYAHPSTDFTPSIYGFKLQMVGESRKNAKAGNFSTSIAFGIGNRDESKSKSDVDELDLFDGNIKDIDYKQTHLEFGVISGYRWTDWLLHYGNIFIIEQDVEGKVSNVSGSLVNAKFDYDYSGVLLSTGFILYPSQYFHLKLDYSYLSGKWQYSDKEIAHTVNAGIGFNW